MPGIAVPSDRHPPGLILVENFVSEEEEKLLVDAVRWDQQDAHLSTGARVGEFTEGPNVLGTVELLDSRSFSGPRLWLTRL